jgi:hypothetical protein
MTADVRNVVGLGKFATADHSVSPARCLVRSVSGHVAVGHIAAAGQKPASNRRTLPSPRAGQVEVKTRAAQFTLRFAK